jgi:hypothetical protein
MNRARKARQDEAYLAAVASLPCALIYERTAGKCKGPMHAHHCGRRGFGMKSGDQETVPLCATHHDDYHKANGFFRFGLADSEPDVHEKRKRLRREWAERVIAETQELLEVAPVEASPLRQLVGVPIYQRTPRYEDRLLDLVIRARAIITAHAPCDCQDESETQSAIKCEHCIWLDAATREIA